MKNKLRKKYLSKKKKSDLEKKFFTKFFVCLVILVMFYGISSIKNEKFDLFKMHIANTLDKSTNFNETKNTIENIITNIKLKFGFNNAVPVDNFDDKSKTPFVMLPKPIITVCATEDVVFQKPTVGTVSSPYGLRIHPIENTEKFHGGIDIAGRHGEKIFSAAPGYVKKVGEDEYNGKYVVINHKDNYQTVYIHLNDIYAKKGDEVDYETVIGTMGKSGSATGVNLHFEIKLNGERKDPMQYVDY
jgi:murein DD-endopeptidase MepM/ murein hydrolase activator NlpD